MEEIDWKISDKLLATALWLNRATKRYREIPGYSLMCAHGNRAFAEAILAISDANKLMREKIGNEVRSDPKISKSG
jgi:hypothetical protein